MSVQPSQPSNGDQPAGDQPAGNEGRRFPALVGSLAATPTDGQETAARPAFTARADGAAVAAVPGQADTPDTPAAEAASGTTAAPGSAPADPGAADEPLLSDAAGLRARWQRVQAGFVDGPQEAVGDAADLIEQTAQSLVVALRQRQRELRVMWDHGHADDSAPGDGESATRAADTEHLRQLMQRYRALFNQLCQP
jgi:hypothetical protein